MSTASDAIIMGILVVLVVIPVIMVVIIINSKNNSSHNGNYRNNGNFQTALQSRLRQRGNGANQMLHHRAKMSASHTGRGL